MGEMVFQLALELFKKTYFIVIMIGLAGQFWQMKCTLTF